jgi:hypothetical protein
MIAAATIVLASDHQQTALTELNPRMDITDVYAFPGAGGTDNSRITLVMNTASPIVPSASATARFDPNLLYQFKIDNTGDAIEDLVIQVTFDSTVNNNRVINIRGPVAPPTLMSPEGTPLPRSGTATQLLRNAAMPSIVGRGTDSAITIANAAGPIQVFAGLRDDPFFVDLEGFFRIIPDRRPVAGPLAALPETPTAMAFRGTAAPFETRFGPPVDILTAVRANTLAIVLEMPVSLLAPGANKRIGVWGTISR